MSVPVTDKWLGKGWFSNTSFTTGLKTLPTFRPDALVSGLLQGEDASSP